MALPFPCFVEEGVDYIGIIPRPEATTTETKEESGLSRRLWRIETSPRYFRLIRGLEGIISSVSLEK